MHEQRFLGEILTRRANIAPEKLEPLYALQREKGLDLVDLLVKQNVVDESTIAAELSVVPGRLGGASWRGGPDLTRS